EHGRRGRALRKRQTGLLHRSPAPAPQPRVLLRDLAVQLPHERRGAEQGPGGRLEPKALGRRAAAVQRRRIPRNPAHARDQRQTHAPRPPGPAGRLQPDGRLSPAAPRSLPGFMIPAGSSSAFSARRARRPPAPTSRSIHGAGSRPTAWWWVIVPPPSRIARAAASLTLRHCPSRSSSFWRAINVKYSEAPVSYTCNTWHITRPGAPRASRAAAIARATPSRRLSRLENCVAVSSVSTITPC